MKINLNHKNLFDYLINNDLCAQGDLDFIKIESECSSNFNWVIELPNQMSKLFVKQIPYYSKLDLDDRISQEWDIYNHINCNKSLEYTSSLIPDIVHLDKENSILIYSLPNDYITLKIYYENLHTFPDAIASLLGITLAKLHSETMNYQECFSTIKDFFQDKLQYQLPYPDYLSDYLIRCLEPESLNRTPVQAWRFLGILQQAASVKKVIKELILNHQHRCLTHNNIQFRNILIHSSLQPEVFLPDDQKSQHNPIKLISWEACSWGDPACDLGKAMTGYLIFWLNSMITHRTIDMKKSIQLATIPLEIVRPSIGAMTKSYISIYPEILNNYPEFIKRVVQFAGLGLIYSLLAEFQLQPEIAINHQEIYFYIASQLLCYPEKFLSI